MEARIQSHSSTLYRTAHYTEEQVRRLKESASKQERDIARWFWNNPDQNIGPGRLHKKLGFDWPITSTRRAISNLTDAGILEKTSQQSTGIFGKPEYHWQWKRPVQNVNPQKELFS